jgi:hypothetical protein
MTRSDAENFKALISSLSIELPEELRGGSCYTEADKAALDARIAAYLEKKRAGIEGPARGDKPMQMDFIEECMRSFLATLPEPFYSMSIETEEDRERLALALREYALRPMPPNASEEK